MLHPEEETSPRKSRAPIIRFGDNIIVLRKTALCGFHLPTAISASAANFTLLFLFRKFLSEIWKKMHYLGKNLRGSIWLERKTEFLTKLDDNKLPLCHLASRFLSHIPPWISKFEFSISWVPSSLAMSRGSNNRAGHRARNNLGLYLTYGCCSFSSSSNFYQISYSPRLEYLFYVN